ncbi:MAG: FAD:protein FMN transferase, partial [Deltaproteobacteria bacterium]|nr:FAD:protein FMN transferase [Deltaproteobacteria bacterium]
DAISRAFIEIRHIEELMSLYKPGSDLSRLNQSAGKDPVRVNHDLIEVVEQARHFTAMTKGAFDITIESLMKLWGFRSEESRSHMPGDGEIRNALEAIGMHNVLVDRTEGSIALLGREAKIDLGGIAVGYSVDRAVEQLRRAGIEQAFINHSGDAYALGVPPESEGWEIGAPDPLNPSEIIATFKLCDRGVSTSGNYEKCLMISSWRVGHILDPRTGRPGNTLLSTTLFAPTVIEADALSTGLFCLDPSDLEKTIKNLKGLELFAITGEKRQVYIGFTSSALLM